MEKQINDTQYNLINTCICVMPSDAKHWMASGTLRVGISYESGQYVVHIDQSHVGGKGKIAFDVRQWASIQKAVEQMFFSVDRLERMNAGGES